MFDIAQSKLASHYNFFGSLSTIASVSIVQDARISLTQD